MQSALVSVGLLHLEKAIGMIVLPYGFLITFFFSACIDKLNEIECTEHKNVEHTGENNLVIILTTAWIARVWPEWSRGVKMWFDIYEYLQGCFGLLELLLDFSSTDQDQM